MRTITKHVRVTLSLMCAVLLLSTTFAACSDSNDPKEPNNPDTPVNTGDDMTVPASGGTITKGDISITFPSGTFDSDTKVTITEVKKGTAIGRCEASPFYQLTLPLKTSKPFTVRMKSNYTDGEAEFVLLTAGYSISYDRDLTNETVLETTYSNGEYTATMPIIEGNDSKENGSVIIGLGRLPDDIIAASRTVTRGIGSVIGLDGNVKWNLSINYGYIDKYSQNYKKLDDALVDVNMHIKEAIKTIHGLGIKMPDGVTINYRLCALKDAYGEYSASKICRSEDCIYLHDGMVLKGQTNLLKQTIIHETLHNYQTYYLPYYYLPLRMAALKNDQRSMYEIGAIWIEKYANGGKINGDWQLWESGLCKTFNNHFRIGLSQSSNDVKALFEDYDLQGYAQAPLLYHMIKRNNSTVVGDTVVANLYGKFMAKISEEGYTLIDVLNEWYYDNYKDHFFDGTDNINNYYLSLWKGELMNDFNFSMFELYMLAEEMPFDYMNEKKSKLSLDGKVYPYGCEGLIFKMDRTCFKDSLLNNDEMVIKQEAEGVKTYLLYSNGSKIIQYPKVAVLGDSICIPGAELEALRPKGVFNNYFFLLTVRENSSLTDKGSIPSKESVEIRSTPETLNNVITMLDFDFNVKSANEAGKTRNVGGGLRFDDETNAKFKVTSTGNRMHVECSAIFRDEWNEQIYTDYNATLSFDINEFSHEGHLIRSNAITNCKYECSSTHTEFGATSNYYEKVEIANIPWYSYSVWMGMASSGVKFSNYYWDDGDYTLVDDPNNTASIQIEFSPDFLK